MCYLLFISMKGTARKCPRNSSSFFEVSKKTTLPG
ncbi:hypothetical protein I3842_16G108300 [Carya illinoinensis]|uniref:Uncharacterized protein n=1 Tax=Carya illinoinensis TaxID=32201 RepID=A0A922A1K7_CARIL|nr:hypothetical protein I3842_16G108300 [Carya illinoinensis]